MGWCIDRPGLPQCASKAQGFTLLETVITIAIMGILAGAMAPMMSSSLTAYDALNETTVTVSKLRYAMERMVREVRQTAYNSGGSNYEITTMTASALSFTKEDGVTVTLTSSGSNATLQYSTPAVTSTLSDQLNTLAFNYYQSDGSTAATDNTDVAFVAISLKLEEDGDTYPQRSRVTLRNLQ